ncbi:MAG: cysteine hydrolase [Hyphomicrobiaceae bacterium]
MASSGMGCSVGSTALLLLDLVNDVVHPDGAYGRAGLVTAEVRSLPARLAPLAADVRATGGWVISAPLTFVEGRNGEPFIPEQLRRLRPFLGKGDFKPGSWGHQLADALEPADITIEKITYSAFYMTRLEWVLHQAHIDRLLIAGMSTNASVVATVRDAQQRDFGVIVAEDGCACFEEVSHRSAISDLAKIAEIRSIAQLRASCSQQALSGGAAG